MNILYQICEISATVFETFIIMEFIVKLLGSRYTTEKSIICFIILFAVINAYMIFSGYVHPEYSVMSDLIVLVLYVIYSIIMTKNSLIYRIITPALCITVIMMINILLNIIISNIFNTEPNDLITGRNILRVISLFISKFLFFIVTRIVLKIIRPNTVIINKNEIISVSVIFFISIVIIGICAEVQFKSTDISNQNFTLLFLLGISIINITVVILFNIIARKNKEQLRLSLIEVKYNEQKKLYMSIESVYSNLQIIRHDLKNELLCIEGYIDMNKKEEAKEYIEKITQTKLGNFKEFVQTGHDMIDAIINIKLNMMREHNIAVSCRINADFSCFNPDDIVVLFSNAVDNAFESSLKQNIKEVNVSIENKRNYLCISISNHIDSSVLNENANLITTKSDKTSHGFGTQSIVCIVDKYDGMLDFYEKDNFFIVSIMLRKDEKSTN